MFKKDKIALLLIPVVMVGMGFFLVTSGGEAQKALSAFVLHLGVLSNGIDGNSAPDYRFIKNQKVETASDVKKDIILPEVLQMATENRCNYLIKKLDSANKLEKFDVAYTMVCFDKYPTLFTNFFNELHPVAAVTEKTTVKEVSEVKGSSDDSIIAPSITSPKNGETIAYSDDIILGGLNNVSEYQYEVTCLTCTNEKNKATMTWFWTNAAKNMTLKAAFIYDPNSSPNASPFPEQGTDKEYSLRIRGRNGSVVGEWSKPINFTIKAPTDSTDEETAL